MPIAANSPGYTTWGWFRVVAGGQDVTYYRGKPIEIISYSLNEPFGCGPAALRVRQVTPRESVRSGDPNDFGGGALSWMQGGTAIEIVHMTAAKGVGRVMWSGEVASQGVSFDEDTTSWTIELIGDIDACDYVHHEVPAYLPPTDIGVLIANELNRAPGRRIGSIGAVTTGIQLRHRGQFGESRLDYVQKLLALATTDSGLDQWTVARTGTRRRYQIRLKDRTTIHGSFQVGAPGIRADLDRDLTTAPNVIYGHGTNSSGGWWMNMKYPNAITGVKAYPNSNPSQVLNIGSTDASTTSGSGVTDWQERAQELGYNVTVDGVYNAADAAVAKKIQRQFGITVDGIVGPQTWTASFAPGGRTGTLGAAIRLPLVSRSAVEPRLYSGSGDLVGTNTGYNSRLLRVETDIAFADGISRDEAYRSALAQIERDSNAAWSGTITLRADLKGMSRWDIREGMNIQVRGLAGQNVRVHVAGVEARPFDGSVTLTVDENNRDLATIAEIIERRRNNAPDPARRPGKIKSRSTTLPDAVWPWDTESPAGIIPKIAIFGGLWTVVRAPMAESGTITAVDLTTSGPATKFCVALFGKPITANQIDALVPAPLTAVTGGGSPWDEKAPQLENYGWIETFGGPGNACGYYPKTEATGGSITGRFRDVGSLEFATAFPPWVWIAFWSPTATFVKGRFYPAPMDA